MTEIIRGFHLDIGGREVLEDRVDVQEFRTPGNLSLLVAVVADGVGGENKGERAAQLAIDSLFQTMRGSSETDVPTFLSKAVFAANQAVHHIAQATGGASTTLAVAAIHEGSRLYIANVGDSRVYLCRDQELTQLTMDHTFANMMPLQGKMSREEAQANPRAEALMRAIGPRPNIPVDIGFYVNTTDPQVAISRGKEGLALREGDSILVCSDGLIKNSRVNGQPLTTPQEIVRVLNTQEGEKAARSLVSFALGRDADDNVSAAVMQMPDSARARMAKRPYYIIGGVALTLFLVTAVIVWFLLQNQNRRQAFLAATVTAEVASANEAATRAAGELAASVGQAGELSQAATGTAVAAETATAIVAAFTPTSTSTPRPTPIPNQIGFFVSESQSFPFTLADMITTEDEFAQLHINHDEAAIAEDAIIFVQPNTQIEFESVTADSGAEAGISFWLFEGSDIFLDTGGYQNGADISPIGDTRISFLVAGSCLSVQYDQLTSLIDVGCYEGVCRYRAEERDEPILLEEGDLLRYDVQERSVLEVRSIRPSEGAYYRQILLQTSAGRTVYDRCVFPLFPPTQTPSPTPLPTATSTATPVPSDSGSTQPVSATNTPKPATFTPVPQPATPTATNTPVPSTATNTAVPTATDTPAPTATDTALPPTATSTPEPIATDAPEPTPTNTLGPPPTRTPES
jgi:PPM family protein phosphatase